LPAPGAQGSAQLHRPAGARSVHHADGDRQAHRAAPPGPSAVHPERRPPVGDHRRPHPGGHAQGIAGGQFVPGRRQQGHLDRSRRRGGRLMLSRVAESIYWMARYLERAENTARMVMVNANLLLDLPKGAQPEWQPLVTITGATDQFEAKGRRYEERAVVMFLLGDRDYPGSVINSLRAARENARTIRDIMPREAWEQINELNIYARDHLDAGLSKRGRHLYLKRLILGVQTITGMFSGTMTKGQGYQFLVMGRSIERADMTTRIIDVRSADLLEDSPDLRPFRTIQWVSVLKSLTAYQMYRQSRQARVTRSEV